MSYLDKTAAEMRDKILIALSKYIEDDVRDIDRDTLGEIDAILRDNLRVSFKNGLEAGQKPKKDFSRRK